jgi:hypothetical protein
MNEATKQFFLKLNLEVHLDGSEYVDWAMDCLEEGLDSKSLRLLAGFDKKHPYKSDFEELFRQSLNELDWKYLSNEEVLFDYTKSLARQILSGEIKPAKGVEKIYGIYIQLGLPSELQIWDLLYDGHSSDWYDRSRWLPFMSTYNHEKWLDAVKLEAKNLVDANCFEVTK